MGNAGSAGAPEQAKKPEEADGVVGAPPSTVRFFPAAAPHAATARAWRRTWPPPATSGRETSTSISSVFQVYALGAFLVARWGWAKWKESKDRDDSEDGQLPPPAASS
uniref:Uncharacterized protein n=1 Tax=Aegilops tauschii TaxID=37682 RepID=M8B239_AEGTA